LISQGERRLGPGESGSVDTYRRQAMARLMSTDLIFIDRSPSERSGMIGALREAGYDVVVIEDCHLALDAVKQANPAITLVGRLSAEIFRNDYCRRLREIAPASGTAIIVLMPGSTRLARIRCLEDGADEIADNDIPAELLIARIRDLHLSHAGCRSGPVLKYGPIEMNVDQHRARVRGNPLSLSPTTFQVLRFFLERPEQILPRQAILANCAAIGTRRSLAEHVSKLRAAMAPLGMAGSIRTVAPLGYMLSLR